MAKDIKTKKPPKIRVLQLCIELKEVKPLVWRLIAVPENITLNRLHHTIQIAMGWFDEHLHEFKIGAVRYGAPDPDGGTSVVSELRKTLAKVLDGAETFEYIYDFGDDWRHQISIEKIVPANKYSQLPFCINGAGACPPEDSGGPSGYMEFVEAISNPGHPAHLHMMGLYDLVFDPYEFEIDDVNDWLTRVKT